MTDRTDLPSRRLFDRRADLRWLLQVLGLCGFAVTQPVLDVFGRSPETFVFREAGAMDVIAFALLVAVLPAILVWLGSVPWRLLGTRVHAAIRAAVVWGLCSVIVIQVLKRGIGLLGAPLVALGAAAGAVMALALLRTRAGRWWLTRSWVAAVAFVLIFLLVSPTARLLRPGQGAEAAPAGRARPVPVVMVVFDEFPLGSLLDRRGRINDRLYPSFAELASAATWYRNYTVTDPSTFFSIPTLLTGQLGRDRDKQALAIDYPNTLFTLLSGSHRLHVYEPVTGLCPARLCDDPAISATAGRRRAPSALPPLLWDAAGIWKDLSFPGPITRDITAQFAQTTGPSPAAGGQGHATDETPLADLLAALGGSDARPGLYYAHELLPHTPWLRLPSGATYRRLGGLRDLPVIKRGNTPARWSDEAWPVQLTRQRHLLQVQYVDGLIGRLLDRLRSTGLYDRSLVIVTADHGLGLHPGRQWREPNEENQHEILWPPLLIKYPGQREGAVDDRNLMAPDLLPTIADVLGVRIPWRTDGRTMLREGDDGPAKTVIGHVPFTLGPGEITRARERMVLEAFAPEAPTRDPALWPYRVGPGARLVGERVADLTVRAPWPGRAELDLPRTMGRFRNVDPSRPLPAFVWGRLPGSGPEPLVAVAVNGRVGGVSSLFTKGEDDRAFAVLTPEAFFRPGRNTLELFVVQGDVLRPLAFRTAAEIAG